MKHNLPRNNAVHNILNLYVKQLHDFSFLDGENSDYEKGKFIVRVSLLEVLLSWSVVQNNEAREKSKEILQALDTGYEGKIKYADYFKGIGFRSNVYSRVHIITEISKKNMEKLPQNAKNSALVSGMADEQTLQLVDELSYQLIK